MADPMLSYVSAAATDPPHPVMRDGPLVVAIHGAAFPLRCVYCNEPATRTHRIYWYTAGNASSFRLARDLRLYADVMLCPRHVRQRRAKAWIAAWPALAGFCFLLLAVLLMRRADPFDPPRAWIIATLIVGAPLAALGLLRLLDFQKILLVEKMQANVVCLSGAAPAFLDSLPPVPVGGTGVH